MVMSCYAAVDTATVAQILSGGRLPQQREEALLRQRGAPPRPTPQQYRLLEATVREEQERLIKEMRPEDLPGAVGLIGWAMPPLVKAAYVTMVIAGSFGAVLWMLRRQLRGGPERERVERALRKLEKAAARLERKKLS